MGELVFVDYETIIEPNDYLTIGAGYTKHTYNGK